MATWWRAGLGPGRTASEDQEDAIVAAPTGRRTVDAGAGTGKTSTLALRALYLIESGHARADQIVVVTFTKKAAAEIGSRIADTLDRARADGAAFASGGRGVRCTTIHALAAEILREFAFEFGFVTAPRAIGDGEAHGIFHEAFTALLDGKLDVDVDAFPIAEVNLENLERDLGKLALRLKNHGVSPREFASRALAESDRFGAQTWGQLWSPGFKPGSRIKFEPNKETVSPEEIAREAERERANIRVVAAVFVEFDRLLLARGLATYGDLIGVTTRHLREHPETIALLRARWRYVLLDESQDTSALQLALIEAIFGAPGEPDAAGMMPVGDRRQAIYGFNGASEDVMQRIAEKAASTHALVVNRRSPQEIVDAGHEVLVAAGVVDDTTPRLSARAGSGTFACIRVQNFGVPGQTIKEHVAAEAAAIAREIARLTGDATMPTKPSDIAILVRRRTHAAAYVRALNDCGIGAALDRRSGLFAADEVRDALAWMSLLVDLTDRQAAVRILQSPLCGLNDAAMIRIAAATDWLELLLRNAIGTFVDADGYERIARVRAWLVASLPTVSLPLASAVAALLQDIPIVASYARLGETIGAQAIVNLRSFAALADEFAGDYPEARLGDFVADVKRRILYDDEPEEAELDLDGVRVMTIHQAKGLEWPYVFVACSTKHQYGSAGPSDALVKYDLASGALALKNDVDGRETFRWLCLGTEHDPETGQRIAEPVAKAAAKREQARIFYVAITRARHRVYLTSPSPDGAKGHPPYFDSIRHWAERMSPGVELAFDRHDAAIAEVTASVDSGARPNGDRREHRPAIVGRDRATRQPQLSLFAPRMSFTSISAFRTCPRMAKYRYRLLLPDLREPRPRYVGVDVAEGPFANAARVGTLTHRILELWGAARIEATARSIDDAFAQAELEFADVTPNEAADAQARARQAAEALEAYEIVGVEESFELVVGDTVLEGYIDLIARGPDGALHVIDYKTGITDDAHYEMQLALYRHAYMLRSGAEHVAGAILRLTPEKATMSATRVVDFEELRAFVASAGRLESDVATPGSWCVTCAYNDAPCLAPATHSLRHETIDSAVDAPRR